MSRSVRTINQAKRRAVFDAAVELLAERGPGATLSEIAKRSGVSRQTLYNHFKGKAELLNALLATISFWARCPACPPASSASPEEALCDYAAALLEWVQGPRQASGLRALVRGFDLSPEQAAQLQAATLAPALRSLERLLTAETLNRRLAVDQPAQTAALFLNMVIARPQLEIIQGAAAMTPAEIAVLSRLCGRLLARGYACEPTYVAYLRAPEERRIDAAASQAMQA